MERHLITRRSFLVNGAAVSGGFMLSPFSSFDFSFTRKDEVRVGLIGLGKTGKQRLVDSLSLRTVVVDIICDKSRTALEQAASIFVKSQRPLPEMTQSVHPLLSASRVSCLLITVPLTNRAEVLQSTLRAGKKIYIEPPWSSSIDESAIIMKMAFRENAHVRQAPVDPAWDTRIILGQFGTIRREKLKEIEVTVFRNSNGNDLNFNSSLLALLDQIGLSRELLGVDYPCHTETHFAPHSLGVKYSYKDPKRCMILQTFDVPHMSKSKTVVDITLKQIHRNSVHRIESVDQEMTENEHPVAASALETFLVQGAKISAKHKRQIITDIHSLNVHFYLAAASLKQGRGITTSTFCKQIV